MANGRNPGRRAHLSAPVRVPRDGFAVEIQSDVAEKLAKLEAGLKEQVAASGAHAGILVFYNEMRARVPVEEGTLHDSIYHYRDRTPPPNVMQYYAGPNKRKAPHWYNVEYGHWLTNVVVRGSDGRLRATREKLSTPKWIPGKPYVRPSYDAKKSAAVSAANTRMAVRYRELVATL